jgi:hypothetical protein
VRVRPISPDALVGELAERIVGRPDRWLRVAIDGADAAEPAALADTVAAAVRLRGRPVVRVRVEDHLRPASLRYERGRDDPDGLYDDWLDEPGLRREVLDPLGPHGSGCVRARRYDPLTDRATRDEFAVVPAGGVLLLSGGLLLGRGLPLELTVHLHLSPAALARRTPSALAWTLPAYDRYREEVDPAAVADLVVRLDDPRHPALVEPQ